MVKEALEKKVVWPWVAPSEDDSNRRKDILKSNGFKEWKNPKAKSSDGKWKLRYPIEAKTGKFQMYFGKYKYEQETKYPKRCALSLSPLFSARDICSVFVYIMSHNLQWTRTSIGHLI